MSNKAVLWDVNGVIIDDMRVHFVSYREVLAELGYGEISDDYLLATTVGVPPNEFFGRILPTFNCPVPIEEVLDRKQKSYLKLISNRLQSPPGLAALMEDLRRAGFKQAVASGTTRLEVETITKGCGVRNYFDEIVSCEDVERGKPFPDPFLKAASLLGIAPSDCAVVEDGAFGIRAARAAGMRVIAVTNTQTREQLSEADIVVDTLEEVDAARVLELITDPRPVA